MTVDRRGEWDPWEEKESAPEGPGIGPWIAFALVVFVGIVILGAVMALT